jgi:hypothetical protein
MAAPLSRTEGCNPACFFGKNRKFFLTSGKVNHINEIEIQNLFTLLAGGYGPTSSRSRGRC